MSSQSLVRAVLRECHERLVDELESDKVTEFLHSKGFISDVERKTILSEKNQMVRIRELLKALENCKNDEALEALINYLRGEGTQPHLWTLLEYSRVKHRRIRANLMAVTGDLHI